MKALTRSYTYLLPGLAQHVKVDKQNLENVWLGIENVNNTFDNNVYLQYNNEATVDFENQYYINKYSIENKQFVAYEYPHSEIYETFIQSKYSKFPERYKSQILNYHNLSASSLQAMILFKSDNLKKTIEAELFVSLSDDVELGEKIEFTNEQYQINYSLTNK